MSAILEQLELNSTFFIQFALLAVLFAVLTPLYFKPFLGLFEARHRRTVEDKQSAEEMLAQADAKFEEYKRLINEERIAARKEIESAIEAARKEESAILAKASEEAKKITQEAQESLAKQRDALSKSLESDVESLAKALSDRLLARKA